MTRIEANIPGRGYAEVTLAEGKIQGVEASFPERADLPYLSPGFIDTQLNGYAGVHFSDPDLTPDRCLAILPALWEKGCTSFCPTLISNTIEAQTHLFRVLRKACETSSEFNQAVPCFHQEGPYMSPGPSAGAHRPEFMKDPDWEEFSIMNAEADGRIGLVTLAPEWPGAEAFTRQAVDAGIRVSLSHTDGSPEDVHRLAAAGASLSTHLGNGCPQLWDRHQAPFWAQLDNDGLAAGLICDRFHLSDELTRIITRVKGLHRCLLVTDAVYVAGLEPGPYTFLGKDIELLESGQVVQADRKNMAGSSLNMADAVSNFMEITGLTLEESIIPATRSPGEYLGGDKLCSAIEAGQPANLVLFTLEDGRLDVQQTLLHGRTVYRR